MAATDKHYRNQKTLNLLFAFSCVAMLLSILWMLVDDYKREYKQVQREFRDVEESVSLNAMLERLPHRKTLDDARDSVTEKRQRLDEKKKDLDSEIRRFNVERAKIYSRYQDAKALFDSRSSYRDQEAEHLGEARTEEQRAIARKHLEERDLELERLKQNRDRAQKDLDDNDAAYASEITSVLKPYEDELNQAEDYLKEIVGEFDRFAKLTAEKKWKTGDSFRNLPIIDGFASPTRITQFVSDELPIDYGGFKYVTRYDRCATCHLGIESATYSRDALNEVARGRTPETAISELIQAVKAAEVKTARDEAKLDNLKDSLNEKLAAVRSTIKDKVGLPKAVAAFSAEVKKAEPLMEPTSYKNVNAALARLVSSADRQERLWTVQEILAERKAAHEKLTFHPDDVPKTLRDVKMTAAQIMQYAAHPRLDLFVESNSTHPMEKFGCTICHAGQGSATDFQNALHMPNDAVQKKSWQAGGADGHKWSRSHDWDFPMMPKRFTESSCLKCHHQVNDLVRQGTKEEAPKLSEGYHLVKENGCFGCHEISGNKGGRSIGPDLRLEPTPPLDWLPIKDQLAAKADTLNPPGTMRKVGPSLRRLSEKVPAPADKNVNDWLLSWIKNPRGFRPDTKMPHFYGQSTNNKEFLAKEFEDRERKYRDQSLYPDAELYSIAYYLQSESTKALAGEDTTKTAVYLDLQAKAKKLEEALTYILKQSAKQGLTVAERMKLSENKRERDKLKKELDALRRRYRDLALMSRPLDIVFLNEMGEQLQEKLDHALESGLSEDEIKETFDTFSSILKKMQTDSVPVAVLKTQKELIDSTGKAVAWSTVPEKPTGDGKALFTEKGCLACHSRTDVVVQVKNPGGEVIADDTSEANFGPELSRIGLKLGADKKNARSWIIQWVLNPNVYHPRTKMPITHLNVDEAAAIADFLLSSNDKWTPQTVNAPSDDTLIELASLSLVKVPAIGRQKASEVLKTGLPKSYTETLPPDADEQLLIEGNQGGRVNTKQLMRYIGKKAISRQGCFACHDVPGFEAAKPIGTGLNDWGKKDPERLAFEDAGAFVKEHFRVAETRDDLSDPREPKPSSAWVSAAGTKAPTIEEFYEKAIDGHQREGFLQLKLAEPRSYDFGRVREWDDRLRMPQFKFARTHRRGKEGAVETVDSYKARRNQESKGEYDAESQFEEARAREAVMTFVLGLIAEPIPLKFVNNPKTDRLAEVRGRQVIEKYNCAGCHEIRPGVYEFKVPESKKADFMTSVEGTPDLKDHVFPDSNAWTGRPSPLAGMYLAHGVSTDDRPTYNQEDKVYRIRLTEALRYTDSKGATRNKPASDTLDIPVEGVVSYWPTYGGDFARLIGPYLKKANQTKFDSRTNQRAALPPPLLREGERVQPQWLFKFLRDPEKIRPMTVLRMPKFNMSDEEARALVEYFAAVDKLNNPDLGLNESFTAVPQKDWSYWQKKNTAYLASGDKDLKKHLDDEREEMPVVWKRALQERIAERNRDVEGLRSLVTDAEKDEAKAKEALKNAKKEDEAAAKAKLTEAETALKTAKGRADDANKELDVLKGELEKGNKSDSFKAFIERWQKEEVYAGDAYRMITDAKSICMTCHSIGNIRIANEQGPNLGTANERLRPRWTNQWIASPNRLITYPTYMPQNFPKGEKPSPHFLYATQRDHAEAARDVLMNLPAIANLDVNRYRLAPKGGK